MCVCVYNKIENDSKISFRKNEKDEIFGTKI